jgi:hypothetical protein
MSNANGGYTTGRRMASSRLRLSFWGSVHAELVKLASLASTWWLMGITAVLLPAMAALSVWSITYVSTIDLNTGKKLGTPNPVSSAELWSSVGSNAATVALVIGIFGVMAITSEYTTSCVQASLSVNPRRVMFMNAKAVAAAAFTGVFSLLGMLLSWVIMLAMTAGSSLTPIPAKQSILPFVVILGAPVILMLMAVLAQGLGAMCRSTVGGVFSLVGLLMILSQIVSITSSFNSHLGWLASISMCLPDMSISNFMRGPNSAPNPTLVHAPFSPVWWQSGLIFLAWTAVFYVIGVIVIRRSDVKG